MICKLCHEKHAAILAHLDAAHAHEIRQRKQNPADAIVAWYRSILYARALEHARAAAPAFLLERMAETEKELSAVYRLADEVSHLQAVAAARLPEQSIRAAIGRVDTAAAHAVHLLGRKGGAEWIAFS